MPSPRAQRCQIAGVGGVDVPQRADIVGDEHLFCKAADKAFHAGGELVDARCAETQLIGHIFVAHDGAGDELREQRHECAEADIVPLHVRIPAVDVDGIAHRLESVERDAYRQRQPQRRDVDEGQGAERGDDEVIVLEKAQQAEVDDDIDNEHDLCALHVAGRFVFADEQAIHIVHGDGEHHQQDIDGLSPAVKDQVCHEEHRVPPLDRGDIVHCQHDRQVYEHEKDAGKDH